MKKICLVFNHLQHQDGVSRSAIAIANILTKMQLAEVTLISVYKDEKDIHKLLDPRVKTKHVFGFYFHGMPHFVKFIPKPWIVRKVLKGNYDIMVGFQEELPIKYVASFKSDYNTTKFAWIHGFFDWLIPKLRYDYEAIGNVVCVSKCNADRLKKELPGVNTDYCYNPIDDIAVRKSGEEEINITRPKDKPLFISVGRMSPEKGYIRLLKICKRLKEEGYKFVFWLIGDGPVYDNLLKLNRELELEDTVLFLGQQNNPHKYTAKADLFVCSSFIEGYSTACAESIMLGVPIITTNVSGAEEIIQEAGCGMIVNRDDESLYKGIKTILDKPDIIVEWKGKLNTTRDFFSADYRIKRLIRIFDL